MKTLNTILFLPLLFISVLSKRDFDPAFCASDWVQATLFELHPEYMDRAQSLERAYLEMRRSAGDRQLFPYMLPVVVHIIHDNGAENIPDAMVLQGLQHLNEAFANSGYYDQGTGVNTQIQFCLAKRDPDGNATTGINRVVSPLTELNYTSQDLTMKDLIRWDPLRYINIWLVREICSNNGCGVAGYAYLPSAHGSGVDGIVMEAKWFGSTNGNSGVQIHEMGHYLGLYHTFEGGCTNNDCLTDGDRVCDTPPDQSTVPVPCGGSANSCSTDAQSGFPSDQPDMFWNYMDYGDWDCYSAFTQGQTDRMGFFIENVRYSLLDSDACQDPCLNPILAGFTTSANPVDAGTTIDFTNTSSNGTTFQWSIDGVTIASGLDLSYPFNTVGTYVVSLDATNADPNCSASFQDTIEVVCPVSSSFTPTNLFPVPGEIVNFANNSSNGTSFTWTVDGITESTAMGFSYVFPTEGSYTVCLEVDNGFCQEQYCQVLFAFEPAGSCEQGFIKAIGGEGTDEYTYEIVAAPNGNFLMAGGKNGYSLLMEVDQSGTVIWEKAYDFLPNQVDFIKEMFLDSQGFLVITGRDDLVTPNNHFLAKYDMATQSFVWERTWGSPSYARMDGILERPDNGNYLFYGLVDVAGGLDNYVFEVNKDTGAPLWHERFDLGGTSDHFLAHQIVGNTLYLAGAQRYAGGLDKIRASIFNLSFDGNLDWARTYFHSQNQLARTYTMDLQAEGDTLVALARGSFTGSDLTNSAAHLFKTNLAGELLWGRSYTFPSGTEVSSSTLLILPNGYLLQGNYKKNGISQIYFIRTDKAGNVLWAKEVGTPAEDSGSSCIFDGNAIYFTGWTQNFDSGSNKDILFGKIPLDESNQNPDCFLFEDLTVTMSFIQSTYDQPAALVNNNNVYNWNTANVPEETFSDPTTLIAGCECPDTEECQTTFVKTLGQAGPEEGRRLIAEPTGGFLLGGNKGDSSLLVLLDGEGHPVWERTFKVTPNAGERIVDLYIDSEQFLLGVGITDGPQFGTFTFKYDYQNGTLLWLKLADPAVYPTSLLLTILEKAPGDNYLVSGQTQPNGPPGQGCDAVLLELDRNSGNTVWSQNYHLGSCETFNEMIIHANSIYTTGRYNFAGGGTDKMRPALTQIDLNGNALWSRLYLVDVAPGVNARLYSTDLIVDNGLVVSGHGDPTGSSTTDVEAQMFKTDFTGNLIWARYFNIPGGNSERLIALLNLPDGYLGLGNYNSPATGDALFLIKTDKNGLLQWAKSYGGPGADAGRDFLFQNGTLFITGSADVQANGDADLLLARLNLDGTTPDDCDFMTDLVVQTGAISQPYDGSHPLTVFSINWPFSNPAPPLQTISLEENILCETPCVDSCQIAPDAALVELQAHCQGELLSVSIELCNEGGGLLYQGTPIAFYLGDPTAGPAPLLGVENLPVDLLTDSCLIWNALLPGPTNTPIFAVANEDGSTPLPLVLDDNFTGYDSLECDYSDNLGSFQVVYDPPLLDLGPDTIMCGFGVVSLLATPGFESYMWQDGSTDPSYTATEPGAHWVTVVDSCGGVQSDTLLISVYSSALSADTLSLCSGDTITLFGTPVSQPGEYSALFTGFNGCDSLAVVVVEEASDTSFVDLASSICADSSYDFHGQLLDSSGTYLFVDTTQSCTVFETLTLTVLPNQQTSESLSICSNQTIDVFGTPTNVAGTYQQTFQAQNGCDSTHTIELTVLDTLATSENLTICANETADIFGTPTNVAGTYQQTFQAQNGCDSVHTVELSVLDTLATQQELTICQGETANVFGTPTAAAGVYAATFTAQNGCDSIHTIELIVLDTISTLETIAICQGETADIFGMPSDQPGLYAQTFTAQNGCDSTHSIQLIVFDTTAVFESLIICANETADIFGTPTNLPGLYTATFSDFNGCDSTHTIELTVLDTLATSESLTICANETADIFGTPTNVAGTYQQTFQAQNGCDSVHTIELSVLDTLATSEALSICAGESVVIFGNPVSVSGTYTQSFVAANGCDSVHAVNLTVLEPIDLELTTSEACPQQADGGATAAVSGGLPPYAYDWGNGLVQDPSVDDLPAGNYSLLVTDSQGCTALLDFAIGESPVPAVDLLTEDVNCHGETDGTLAVTATGPGLSFSLDGQNFSEETNWTDLPAGNYTLLIQDANGCLFEENFSIVEPDSLVIQLAPQVTLQLGEATQLSASVFPAGGLYLYAWSPSTGLSCSDCPDPVLQATTGGAYLLVVTDANGCVAQASVLVSIEENRRVYIPNVFSPDFDGLNDQFTVFAGPEVARIKTMRIFDRWGESVFERFDFPPNDLEMGWDGTFRGQRMNPAVFAYYVEVEFIDGQTALFEGSLTLVR